VLVLAMLPLALGHKPTSNTLAYGLRALAFAVMGAFVASRRPENPIGWIFCGFGVWAALVELWAAFVFHSLPAGKVGEWVVTWNWIVDLTVYAIIFLLFPNGRLMTRRWWWVVWLLVAGCLLATPGQAMNPDTGFELSDGVNPFAVDVLAVEAAYVAGVILLSVGMLASVIAVVIRYRRATGIERLQLRQLVLAGSVFLTVQVFSVPLYYDYALVRLIVPLAFLTLPIAAGLAILRYRLYDIDIVINRALVYGTLTVLGAASYAVWVVALQRLLDPFTQGSDLAVAGATLAVASLFRPAHRRVQRAVDRRFYRQTYDAARSIEAFSARLRDQVDLDILDAELRAVVQETMQPSHVSLWLRPVSSPRVPSSASGGTT
jgi:hypothetical protein